MALISLYILCNFQELFYDILNLSAQKHFCKNVNHLNLFCIPFVEDIVVKSQNCWTGLGWVPVWLVISFSLFILDGNLATYQLKYWFSGIGSFVFSNQYKICIPIIHNMTIFDKVDYSPLRNVSQQKPCSLNGT